jgi:hypothetical protein
MTTYTYETVPLIPGVEPARLEVRQAMSDAPLTRHPETGERIRRVITGGYGLMGVSERKAEPPPQATATAGGHCCGASCGCCAG